MPPTVVTPDNQEIRMLFQNYLHVQDARLRAGGVRYEEQEDETVKRISSGRIGALVENLNLSQEVALDYVNGITGPMKEAEKFCADKLGAWVKTHPIWDIWLGQIYGIGPVLGAGLLSTINFETSGTISQLWAYMGMGIEKYAVYRKDGKSAWKHWFPTAAEQEAWINKRVESRKQFYISITDREGKKRGKFDEARERANFMGASIAGVGPFEVINAAPRRIRGIPSNWNAAGRRILFLVGASFVKQSAEKSFYRRLYDQFKPEERVKLGLPAMKPKKPTPAKAEEAAEKPAEPAEEGDVIEQAILEDQMEEAGTERKGVDGHADMRARRKVVKMFLAHLWMMERERLGLEVRKPYVIDELGHQQYIAPPEPEKEAKKKKAA
jgi:hypothetical protein